MEMSDKCTILEDLCTPLQTVKTHLNNIQHNKILRSKISSFCKVEKCIVGIDEAGRGPVLGIFLIFNVSVKTFFKYSL